MSLKKVTCSILVIAVMIGASALSFTNTTDAVNDSPVTKDIYMLKGETRVHLILPLLNSKHQGMGMRFHLEKIQR